MDNNSIIRRSNVGFFEIVTPEGVTRRVDYVDSAWRTLAPYAAAHPWLKSELSEWAKFAASVRSSLWERMWATGVMAELDKWEARYAEAYRKLGAPASSVNPAVFARDESVGMWVFVLGCAVSAGLGAALMYSLRRP